MRVKALPSAAAGSASAKWDAVPVIDDADVASAASAAQAAAVPVKAAPAAVPAPVPAKAIQVIVPPLKAPPAARPLAAPQASAVPVLKAIQVKVPPPKAPQAAAPPAALEASSAAAEPDVAASEEEMDVDLREWELVANPMLTPTDDYESIPATRIQLVELPSEQAAMHSHTSTYVVSTDLTQ